MTESELKRKVGFYLRVSTDRQAKIEEGSLKNQQQMLLTELNRPNTQHKNWGDFVEAYVDQGISGKTTNRPAFQRMIRDIEIGRINTVLFTELSRLSRSLKDFLNIFEFARKHNCDLVCFKTNIDTTSPYQELVTKILMVFAEFEREMTSRRTSLNAYSQLHDGKVVPVFKPPFDIIWQLAQETKQYHSDTKKQTAENLSTACPISLPLLDELRKYCYTHKIENIPNFLVA